MLGSLDNFNESSKGGSLFIDVGQVKVRLNARSGQACSQ